VSTLDVTEVQVRSEALLDELERAVVGKRAALRRLLLAVLADGHVLLEDVPGVAKTLSARALATVTGLSFGRIQFTPDLMPADVTGSTVLDPRTGDFGFVPGPLFAGLVLADEINRAPPKTQAALLEAMQEHQVTADDGTHELPRPFLVVATQNPLEFEGTYPLPEAQLDRFLARVGIGYPEAEAEWEMLRRRVERGVEDVELAPVLAPGGLLALQTAVERVHVAEPVGRYVVDLVTATRRHPSVDIGASPRGSLAVTRLARAAAALDGRDFVIPDDVKSVAVSALAHRLRLRPEEWVRRRRDIDVIHECVAETPIPLAQ
jgi:MoxR-like ATPase